MIIGITGSIATGKSTVSEYLKELGYTIIDHDKLAYDALTIDDECIQAVLSLFDCGEDGKINRAKLGSIIFNDEEKKKQLEGIVHPYVLKQTDKLLQECHDDIVFLDIPLLYEVHFEYLCDYIVVVYCNEDLQLERLMLRNHYSKEEALSRMQSQMSIEEKKNRANYVLNNEGNLDDLLKQVDHLLEMMKEGNVQWCNLQ